MTINVDIKLSLSAHFHTPTRFLLAVSGGPDSQVLISAFSHVAKGLGHTVSALGVNHGLRPEADGELDLAQSLCEKAGIAFTRESVKVTRGSNLQSRARDARYGVLLKKAYEEKAVVVTAHHFDDRAETVLIRLLRMSEVGCLGVLPDMSYQKYGKEEICIYRPLLAVTREDILGYAKRWGIEFATDPSNSDEHYMRVWIRKTLMPMMKEKSPDIVDKLNRLSDGVLDMHRT